MDDSTQHSSEMESPAEVIARLTKLSHVEFGQVKAEEAAALGCTAGELERDWKTARKGRKKQAALPADIEPWPEEVDGDALLDDLSRSWPSLTLQAANGQTGPGRSVHPEVATNLNNLAVIYDGQGKHAESEPLYQRSLAIREQVLGPEHPMVAMTLENYAGLLRETGRSEEAEEMEARAKAIRAKSQ